MESGIFHETYRADMALRQTPAQKVRLALIIVAVLTFPLLADRYYLFLANQIGIAIIGAIGLNILVGYTGQISLGQGGFMAVGAYTAGLLTVDLGVPWFATIPLAALATAVVGAFFGLPSLRLKGLYLVIATLAAQEIIIWVVTHWDAVTGGQEALVIPRHAMNSDFRFYWVIWGLVGVTVLVTVNLFRTKIGRAWIAIRDHDIAAEVMGVDLFRYKLMSFATSSFFVGLAGALIAHYRNIVTWESFTVDVSVIYLAMIIIGGLGSVSGAILGAVFITLLPVILNSVGKSLRGVIPDIDTYLPFVEQAAFGAVIILFLLFEPRGLRRIWTRIKDYFRLWPFSY